EVLDLLKDLGLEENTLVFFSGDNGGADYFANKDHPRGIHGANVNPKTGVEYRGKKGNLYEGGLRIPMIARWPGKIAKGQVSDLLWYFPDVLPTVTELAGVAQPHDIDGMSIVPELLGAEAAGRPQPIHDYLYWELGGQTAIRQGDLKAVHPGGKRDWELYDLKADPSEQHDLAADRPKALATLTALAEVAHAPVEEGVFFDREIHEKDRRAKFGGKDPNGTPVTVEVMPEAGLLPRKQLSIHSVSSQADGNSRLAVHVIDGDPRTHWHTAYSPELLEHPHELVIDLGGEATVRGIRYLARQDDGWNGAVGRCEVSIAATPEGFGKPIAEATFTKRKQAQ
ncbi:MAG: sulfatase/phosphatase domain-containing protein, partial [Pirellulales bacterium]